MKHIQTFESFLFENNNLAKHVFDIVRKSKTYGGNRATLAGDTIKCELGQSSIEIKIDPNDKEFPIACTFIDNDGKEHERSFEEFVDVEDYEDAMGEWEDDMMHNRNR